MASHGLEEAQQWREGVDRVSGRIVDGVRRKPPPRTKNDVSRTPDEGLHGIRVSGIADDDSATRGDEGRCRRGSPREDDGPPAELHRAPRDPGSEEATSDDHDPLTRQVEVRDGRAG
jgi:hypothetical protein